MKTTDKEKNTFGSVPYNGEVYIINRYQAATIIEAQVSSPADPDDISYMILGMICQKQSDGGLIGLDAALDLPVAVSTKIMELAMPEMTGVVKNSDGSGSGTLPSGKECYWKAPTGRDAKEAKKKYGIDGANLGLVEKCCLVGGESVAKMDVELMDGRDYMSLMNVMMTFPS